MTSLIFSRWRPLTARINFWFRLGLCTCPQKARMSKCTKFRKDISFHGWVITTSAKLKFYFRFQFQLANRHQHLILRRHAKFHVNQTIGGVVMTSLNTPLKFLRSQPLTARINFRFRIGSAHVLRRSGSLSVPNFVKIAQHRAELWLLPVSENERPPYWNSTSGFNFDLSAVIGISFCIGAPNSVWIGPLAA